MKIIVDSATLFSPEEGKKLDMTVIPVSVAIDGKSYRDYEEITTEQFLKLIDNGGIPTSSQPSVGDILDAIENTEEDVLMLTVGDGLSGAYQTALGAVNSFENSSHIHVINSKTLAGPLHYMAKKISCLKAKGLSIEKIKDELSKSIESSISFVIPDNFEFLKRSGRLAPMTAKIGSTLKLLPVMTQTEDKTRIKLVSIKRSWQTAVDQIVQKLKSHGLDENYLITISHAGAYDRAAAVMKQLKDSFKTVETEILELSPALITHGGPGCIVVQAVAK